MNSSEKKYNPGLIKTLSSIQFGITVLIAITIVSIVGTVIPQSRSADFYQEHYGVIVNFLINVFRFDITYRSPLFIGLLCLLGLNLILCSLIKFPVRLRSTFRPELNPPAEKIENMPVKDSIEKKSLDDIQKAFAESGFPLRMVDDNRLYGEKGRLGYLGSSFVHTSLLILLLGGLVSLVTGQRGYIVLEKGQSASDMTLFDESTVPLGFELKLDSFEVEFHEGFPGRPKSYTSSVTVKEPDSGDFNLDIRVNHPLMYNGFTIYQSSYGLSDRALAVSASDDTALVEVRLKGIPDEMPPIVTLAMVQGEYYPVPGFEDSIKVTLAELYGDFKRVQSVSGETNPAVKVDILENNEIKWSVYAFKNFPGMNMPMYDDLNLLFSMLDIKKGREEDAEYYTVLGVVRDRGVPLMWTGAFLIMLGLLLSFYIRPKRIWAYDDNGIVLIGGITKGDTEPLRKLIKKVVKRIANDGKERDK